MGWVALALLVICVIVFFNIRRSHRNPKISIKHKSGEDSYNIFGRMDSFIIRKNGRYEFIVKEGLIIGCRDKSKSSQFVYYGSKNDERV